MLGDFSDRFPPGLGGRRAKSYCYSATPLYGLGQGYVGVACPQGIDVNDHDELCHDRLFGVVLGQLESEHPRCAPLASKSEDAQSFGTGEACGHGSSNDLSLGISPFIKYQPEDVEPDLDYGVRAAIAYRL